MSELCAICFGLPWWTCLLVRPSGESVVKTIAVAAVAMATDLVLTDLNIVSTDLWAIWPIVCDECAEKWGCLS